MIHLDTWNSAGCLSRTKLSGTSQSQVILGVTKSPRSRSRSGYQRAKKNSALIFLPLAPRVESSMWLSIPAFFLYHSHIVLMAGSCYYSSKYRRNCLPSNNSPFMRASSLLRIRSHRGCPLTGCSQNLWDLPMVNKWIGVGDWNNILDTSWSSCPSKYPPGAILVAATLASLATTRQRSRVIK